jgi:hypothetical protein
LHESGLPTIASLLVMLRLPVTSRKCAAADRRTVELPAGGDSVATELGRVVFSQAVDIFHEFRACQASEVYGAGVVFGEQLTLTVGKTIQDLEIIGRVYDPEDIASRVEFLPL